MTSAIPETVADRAQRTERQLNMHRIFAVAIAPSLTVLMRAGRSPGDGLKWIYAIWRLWIEDVESMLYC